MSPLILVVDDVEDNRLLYSQYFGVLGFRVLTANDGPGGIATARADRPDVILLDLGLPGLDGWEVARRLRAESATREITIVALTGHATGEARQRALDAGVDSYLMKPCEPEEVLAEVRKQLAGGELGA